jgi:hypothetical protein
VDIFGKGLLSLMRLGNELKQVKKLFNRAKKVKCNINSFINIRDDRGHTSLHKAVDGGNLKLVQYLIDNGADVDLQYEGKTALGWVYDKLTEQKMENVITDVNIKALNNKMLSLLWGHSKFKEPDEQPHHGLIKIVNNSKPKYNAPEVRVAKLKVTRNEGGDRKSRKMPPQEERSPDSRRVGRYDLDEQKQDDEGNVVPPGVVPGYGNGSESESESESESHRDSQSRPYRDSQSCEDSQSQTSYFDPYVPQVEDSQVIGAPVMPGSGDTTDHEASLIAHTVTRTRTNSISDPGRLMLSGEGGEHEEREASVSMPVDLDVRSRNTDVQKAGNKPQSPKVAWASKRDVGRD